jgi:hypothetical protein
MFEQFNITVTIDDDGLKLKGDERLRQILIRLLRVPSELAVNQPSSLSAFRQEGGLGISERELIAQKKPSGHHQIVAVLAFSLRESGVAEFTADDMRRAYTRAHQRPPKVMAQALRDAKNKYELLEPGSQKNAFRLSPHGERTVVFDLPAVSRE